MVLLLTTMDVFVQGLNIMEWPSPSNPIPKLVLFSEVTGVDLIQVLLTSGSIKRCLLNIYQVYLFIYYQIYLLIN